ncbi:Teichuronic acid biosynthesis protein TuaB [Stieleria neptunia]|uniref:Teichuronic acid biosynthesis protein TuaB n=2 Tax=Stieleria neptunia TaxID=2527979 RepID=A0A518HQV1_9BACT|nr:Teichuronic acid biosynthesis protein TuaB [Stieleria neptunia]
MARLLAPELFGIIEMAYTFFMFAKLMRGFSIAEIIVQRDTIDQRTLSTLYWLNLGICSAATFLLLCLSPVAALMYANPMVGWVAAALSICFLLEGMSLVSQSLLQRDMNFYAIGIREIAEVVVMGVVSVALAVVGFGVWAIVLGTLASLVARNVTLYLVRPFAPSRVFDRDVLKSSFGFAANMSGVKFLGYLRQNFDKILISVVLGASAVGFYGVSRKLVLFPHESVTQIVNRVASRRFARAQKNASEISDLYLRAIGATAILIVPIYVALSVFAYELVPLLLGHQWHESIPLVQVLAFSAMISTLSTVKHRVAIACGKPNVLLRSNLVRLVISCTMTSVAIGWGLTAVAWALLFATLIGWFVENRIIFVDLPGISLFRQFEQLRKPMLAASLGGVAALLLKAAISGMAFSALSVVCICLPSMVFTYTIVLRVLQPTGLIDLAEVGPPRLRRFFCAST